MNGIATNCGVVTPTNYEELICKIPGKASFTHNNIPFFHRMMCHWAYNVALNFQWAVFIEAHNKEYLLDEITKKIQTIEHKNWNMGNSAHYTWTEDTQETIGCIFAQSIQLPGEITTTERIGVAEGSSRRGFINAPIISGRQDFANLEAGFLETNRSFTDGVLRPWSILVQHKGLIANPRMMHIGNEEYIMNPSIKSTIHVYELAKSGECSPNIIRKHWVYENAAPIGVSAEEKSQAVSSDYAKRQASFVFGSYYLEDDLYNNMNMGPPESAQSIDPFSKGVDYNAKNPSPTHDSFNSMIS